MSKTIAIYDGDALAFRASAALDNRSVLVKHLPSERTKLFKNRTEFKDSLVLKGLGYSSNDYEFIDQQNPEPLVNICNILKKQINKINESLFVDDYLVCLSGRSNFRDNLPLPSKYKGQREGLMRPVHLKAAKAYLWKNHPSLLADGHEADDDLVVKGYEYLSKGYTPILVSQDKDAFSASGLTLYDFTQDNPELIKVPEFGSLWDTGKKITGNGFIWLCMQLKSGDAADNWKPSELTGKKYGEKSAYKTLKNCSTPKEALTDVIEQYEAWYTEPVTYTDWDGKEYTKDYKDIFDMYFKCARMLQYKDDPLDSVEFCKKYGVEL